MVETMKGLQQRVQDPPLQLQGEGTACGAPSCRAGLVVGCLRPQWALPAPDSSGLSPAASAGSGQLVLLLQAPP